MPHELLFSEDQSRVDIRFSGDATGEEIFQVNDQLTAHPTVRVQVWNFLGAESITISASQMHGIALQDKSVSVSSPLEKVALLIPDRHRRLSDMYLRYSQDWVGRQLDFETRRFVTTAEAEEWIGESVISRHRSD